jgi:hypothetical protein
MADGTVAGFPADKRAEGPVTVYGHPAITELQEALNAGKARRTVGMLRQAVISDRFIWGDGREVLCAEQSAQFTRRHSLNGHPVGRCLHKRRDRCLRTDANDDG